MSVSDKSITEKPNGVSDVMWKKFQNLKRKREELTEKANEKRLKHLQKQKNKEEKGTQEKCDTDNTGDSEEKEDWLKIRDHLGAHDNLSAACTSQHAPKSGLEVELEAAIADGDVAKAEEISDQLSNREFGEKIANAFDAKRFSERKKKEEEIAKAKKQKKLNWRFDHKEKWEMKANM